MVDRSEMSGNLTQNQQKYTLSVSFLPDYMSDRPKIECPEKI